MNINTLHHKDDEWPISLNHISPPIKHLYVAGNGRFGGPLVAIIGSRRPTDYGRQVTQQLASSLARAGVGVLSGLAIGIDSIAHQAALDVGGRTLAVLPSPLDTIYPARHRALAMQIAETGVLMSEYPRGEGVRKHNFIARNRIIAALADVVIVTEATHKSGTMHTVAFAHASATEVGAVPGPISSHLSAGANQLIKDGCHVITNEEDVFSLLGIARAPQSHPEPKGLNEIDTAIHQLIKRCPQSPAQITAQLTNYEHSDLQVSLASLEIRNIVARLPDGMYALR